MYSCAAAISNWVSWHRIFNRHDPLPSPGVNMAQNVNVVFAFIPRFLRKNVHWQYIAALWKFFPSSPILGWDKSYLSSLSLLTCLYFCFSKILNLVPFLNWSYQAICCMSFFNKAVCQSLSVHWRNMQTRCYFCENLSQFKVHVKSWDHEKRLVIKHLHQAVLSVINFGNNLLPSWASSCVCSFHLLTAACISFRCLCAHAARQIEIKKLEWNVSSRVGSLDNAHHVPGGGDKKVTELSVNLHLV